VTPEPGTCAAHAREVHVVVRAVCAACTLHARLVIRRSGRLLHRQQSGVVQVLLPQPGSKPQKRDGAGERRQRLPAQPSVDRSSPPRQEALYPPDLHRWESIHDATQGRCPHPASRSLPSASRSSATAIACERDLAPSLSRMVVTCLCTVLGLMPNLAAITRSERPVIISARTSHSRGDRPAEREGADAQAGTYQSRGGGASRWRRHWGVEPAPIDVSIPAPDTARLSTRCSGVLIRDHRVAPRQSPGGRAGLRPSTTDTPAR